MSSQSRHRPRSNLYYLKLVDSGISYDEVSGEFAREFDLDPRIVESDVEQAQDEFAGLGLCEPESK